MPGRFSINMIMMVGDFRCGRAWTTKYFCEILSLTYEQGNLRKQLYTLSHNQSKAVLGILVGSCELKIIDMPYCNIKQVFKQLKSIVLFINIIIDYLWVMNHRQSKRLKALYHKPMLPNILKNLRPEIIDIVFEETSLENDRALTLYRSQ